MTLDEMIRAADLDDRTERGMLADALEEAGRGVEAALLRGPGTVTLRPWFWPRTDRGPEVIPWYSAAADSPGGTARCTLAEWLEHGPGVVRANPGLRRVEITDKRPRPTEGCVQFYQIAEEWAGGRPQVGAPESAVIRCHLLGEHDYPVVYAFLGEADAMRTLSARCLEWARRRAAAQEQTETFDDMLF